MKPGLARNQRSNTFENGVAKSTDTLTRKRAERSWIRNRWQDFWSDMNQEISNASITQTRRNLKYHGMSFSPKTNSSILDVSRGKINDRSWKARMLGRMRWTAMFKSTNHAKPPRSMIKLLSNRSQGTSPLRRRHQIAACAAKLHEHSRRC